MKNIFIVMALLFLMLFSDILAKQTILLKFHQSGIRGMYLEYKPVQTKLTLNNIFFSYDQSQTFQDICDFISSAVQATSSVFIDKIEGSFYENYFNKYIKGCLLIISGTWSDLGENPSPIDVISKLLTDYGWSQSSEYTSDGPDGTSFSYTKDDNWCLVTGRWDGGDDSDSTYVPSDSYRVMVICGKFISD